MAGRGTAFHTLVEFSASVSVITHQNGELDQPVECAQGKQARQCEKQCIHFVTPSGIRVPEGSSFGGASAQTQVETKSEQRKDADGKAHRSRRTANLNVNAAPCYKFARDADVSANSRGRTRSGKPPEKFATDLRVNEKKLSFIPEKKRRLALPGSSCGEL